MINKKVYISGSITSDKEHYKQHFDAAEKKLMSLGYTDIVNPTSEEYDNDHVNKFSNEAWIDYIKSDIDVLCTCTDIYMLDNWMSSYGAQIEYLVARKLGLSIIFELKQE